MSEDLFSSDGKIYRLELDRTGKLISANSTNIIVPKNKIIYSDSKDSNSIFPYLIKSAVYDMTNTRVRKQCTNCESDIQIVFRLESQVTFYICELCEHHYQI